MSINDVFPFFKMVKSAYPNQNTPQRTVQKMNKKIVVVLATSAMIVSTLGASVACANKSMDVTNLIPAVTVQVPEIKPVSMINEGPIEVTPVLFQNPAVNFAGNYFNNRTTLFVEADGTDNAKLTIVLAEDAKSRTVLNIDAKFNGDTNSIEYTNGTKKTIALDKDRNAVSEKEIYNNGTGKFVFGEKEAVWNDTTEKISDMVFKFGTPADMTTDTQNGTQKTTKKTAKKTAKKAKKSNKSKKNNKKNTSEAKFTYGKSTFTAKNVTIKVTISKDNSVQVLVVRDLPDQDGVYGITNEWAFSGRIDPKTGILSYDNCQKMYMVRTVHVRQARCDYICGKGELRFDGNRVFWNDYKEHHADGLYFSKV